MPPTTPPHDAAPTSHPPRGERPESHFPASYRTQTEKELETLRFVQNFDLQFRTLYKQRRPLPLIFPNECGVEVRCVVHMPWPL